MFFPMLATATSATDCSNETVFMSAKAYSTNEVKKKECKLPTALKEKLNFIRAHLAFESDQK